LRQFDIVKKSDAQPQRLKDTTYVFYPVAVYGLALGDLNGDGYPDTVAACSDAPNAVYFNGTACRWKSS
jgi:FG-GAP repeat protein